MNPTTTSPWRKIKAAVTSTPHPTVGPIPHGAPLERVVLFGSEVILRLCGLSNGADHHSEVLADPPVGALVCVDTVFCPNISFTEGLARTIIVKTPSTVPKGMNMHSMPAITMQKM
jgi:hypothetical protein